MAIAICVAKFQCFAVFRYGSDGETNWKIIVDFRDVVSAGFEARQRVGRLVFDHLSVLHIEVVLEEG